ncbi:hypothetical protein OJ723_002222 [Salmonella enterica]|nr:hypothetical protein [Salmonella enterica]
MFSFNSVNIKNTMQTPDANKDRKRKNDKLFLVVTLFFMFFPMRSQAFYVLAYGPNIAIPGNDFTITPGSIQNIALTSFTQKKLCDNMSSGYPLLGTTGSQANNFTAIAQYHLWEQRGTFNIGGRTGSWEFNSNTTWSFKPGLGEASLGVVSSCLSSIVQSDFYKQVRLTLDADMPVGVYQYSIKPKICYSRFGGVGNWSAASAVAYQESLCNNHKSGWGTLSLSGVATVTSYCHLDTASPTVEHGAVTANNVEGHSANSILRVRCNSPTTAKITATGLMSGNELDLGTGLKSSISVTLNGSPVDFSAPGRDYLLNGQADNTIDINSTLHLKTGEVLQEGNRSKSFVMNVTYL